MRSKVSIRYRRTAIVIAVVMMILSGGLSGTAIAQDRAPAGGDEVRTLQQSEITADYVCRSIWTNRLRLVFSPDCSGNEQLIEIAAEIPFDYCYNQYTGQISDDAPGDQCPQGSEYVLVGPDTSFFVCFNSYTGNINHMDTLDSTCNGVIAFFTDFRGDITKYACVEENLNFEGCDVFPAGPQNEIRQIGPMPNTSGGFFDIRWQWVFDGNSSPTQQCSNLNDCDNAEIEAALEALPGINDVTVTGGPIAGTVDAPIRIEFVGADSQTDIIPQIYIQSVANTIHQGDFTVADGSGASPGLSYVMPGGTVEIFEVIAGTDPDMPATYGPLVTGGLVDTAGSFIAADLLEGDYVVCADGTGSVAPSCEIVTVFDDAQTIVNNVDLPGMISAEITDTMGGNEIQSYDDFPFACCVVNGGTYSLSFDGEGPSAVLDFDATAAEVETALEGLTNIDPGDVIVTGGPPPVGGPAIVIEFAGQYEGVDVPQLVVNSMLTRNGNPGATWFFDPNGTDQDGFGTTQTLTADARVSGGTFTLSYDGEETAPLDFDATVSEIEAALNALTTINGGGGSVQAFSTWPLTTPLDPQITLAPIEINFVNVPDSDTTVLDVDNSNLT